MTDLWPDIMCTAHRDLTAVAIWDGRRSGGTWHAVGLIHKAKMPVVWIRPNGEPTLSRIPDELFATVPR